MAQADKAVADPVVETWRDYKKAGAVETRNELMERYLPLVRHVAERIKVKLPQTVQVEDLVSAGVLGLMDAIEKYDLGRDVKFETYCSTRVRGAILDELRRIDWVPRLVRSSAHQIEGVSRDLEKDLGRLPTEEELAEALGLSLEDFDELANSAAAVTMVPFSSKFGDGEDGQRDNCTEIIEDKQSINPIKALQKAELKEVITRELSEKERLVIIMYYFDEMTLKEIGAVLNLSESRVCQIHSKILERLEVRLETKKYDLWVE